MRYVVARLAEDNRTTTFRLYVGNSLYYSARNQGLAKSLSDIFYPPVADDLSGEDIAMAIINGAGLSFGGKG